jgi:23S rRNA (guanosine2251-2'-O)-methyltransferase
MKAPTYEIRICETCGLRYPLSKGHDFGERCPVCLGDTTVVLHQVPLRDIARENMPLPEEIQLHVLLDNIRSGWNVGSILRTADGFGFRHAYICGITPSPEQSVVQKTALGAENFITWSSHRNALFLVQELRDSGWQILALENDSKSIPIQAGLPWLFEKKTVLVLGNEVTGVDPEILRMADRIVHLPMHGQKRSYNVAVAFAAASALIQYSLLENPRSTDTESE